MPFVPFVRNIYCMLFILDRPICRGSENAFGEKILRVKRNRIKRPAAELLHTDTRAGFAMREDKACVILSHSFQYKAYCGN